MAATSDTRTPGLHSLASITFTKHHGLGNDFLITVDPGAPLSAQDAIRLCDRRRGVGADGLIVASRHGEDPSALTMTLWNGDGSRAELSGNGLRCLGQALVLLHDDGSPTQRFSITTDGGMRTLDVVPAQDSDTYLVTVSMGSPAEGPDPYTGWDVLGLAVEQQIGVDVGNPHLVALAGLSGNGDSGNALDKIDLERIGPVVEAAYADGINLEVIEVVDRSSLKLRVWERGAGLTEACGSGACAAAWAAARWGLVDDRVTVKMPGGEAAIDLAGDEVLLTGPATFVAVVEVER